jgi:hypothetical protein
MLGARVSALPGERGAGPQKQKEQTHALHVESNGELERRRAGASSETPAQNSAVHSERATAGSSRPLAVSKLPEFAVLR